MYDLPSVLPVGLAAVAVGFAAAGLIVWRDLGPFARLGPVQRVGLAAALGVGVLAFTIKLSIIATLSSLGHDTLAPTIADPETDQIDRTTVVGRPVWRALPEVAPSPADDPPTPAKIELGRRLFFEKALSRDGASNCASCHDLEGAGGGDGRVTAVGIDGAVGPRNTPTVWNAAFQARLFWDGRARSLEEQALGPIANPIEMGADLAEVTRRLAAGPEWRAGFAAAFGDETIDPPRIARALAAFERTLITPDAPYDRFVRGDATALDARQLRGMALFEEVGCIVCHAGPGFSRASLLAPEGGASGLRLFPALPSDYEAKYRLTEDKGAARSGRAGLWRVPSLRNVALTAPYFHNGSVASLEEAVRVMATVQAGREVTETGRVETRVEWSAETGRLTRRRPLPLSEAEVGDIVAFLGALTSDRLAAVRTKR
ncbi:MAG: hypothetical protein LWW93_01340 [Hyphomicrobiales bacterium]|nr:hypothetical protein [Hyphomicrobiales bacterium]